MISVHWIPTHRGTVGDVPDKDVFARWNPPFVKIVCIDEKPPYTEDVPPNAKIVIRNHPMSELYGSRGFLTAGVFADVNEIIRIEYELYPWEERDSRYAWQLGKERPSINPASMAITPEQVGTQHADACNRMATYCESKGVPRARILFEGLNEPQLWANEPPDLTARYYKAFVAGLHSYGLHGVVGNFGVGWPGNGGVADAPPAWDFFKPVIVTMQPGDYLGLHEYWNVNGPAENWRWWGGRFTQCPYDVPILITECGVDTGVVGQWYGGWRDMLPGASMDDKAKRYVDDLWWYARQCSVDGRVQGVFPFTYDIGGREWEKFDIRDEVWLRALWVQLAAEGMPQPGANGTSSSPSPSIEPEEPVMYNIVPKKISVEPNAGTSSAYGFGYMVKEDGSLEKYMGGMGDETKLVHLRAAGSASEAIEPMRIGPHPGYEAWSPGYYSLSPLQPHMQWEIMAEDLVKNIRSPWFAFFTDDNQTRIDFVWTPVAAPSYATLEDALRGAAEKNDVLAVNPDAALCQAGAAAGLWPTSNEFDFGFDGVLYRGQRFRDPASDAVTAFYCIVGDWANIKRLNY